MKMLENPETLRSNNAADFLSRRDPRVRPCHISFSMVRRSHQTQMSCSRRPRPKHRCSPQAPHNFYRTRTRKHKAYRDKLTTTPCALWTWKARRRSSTEAHSDVPTHLRKQRKIGNDRPTCIAVLSGQTQMAIEILRLIRPCCCDQEFGRVMVATRGTSRYVLKKHTEVCRVGVEDWPVQNFELKKTLVLWATRFTAEQLVCSINQRKR